MLPSEDKISSELTKLIGKTLWRLEFAALMATIQFGERKQVLTYKGESAEIGEYSLHLQCEWRLCSSNEIYVSTDMFSYDDQSLLVGDDSSAEERIKRKFYEVLRLQHHSRVMRVVVYHAAAFSLQLGEDLYLDCIPLTAGTRELWRLLGPTEDSEHFVVANT